MREEPDPHDQKQQRGVGSIEKGARLIEVLARAQSAQPLSALAASAGLSASLAHRYLVSFIRAGVVEQNADGAYDLGPLMISAGLAKLARQDSCRQALAFLDELAQASGETVMLTQWNGEQVVAIRWIESRRLLNIHIRPGATLPLLNSAAGRIFAAFLPEATAQCAIAREWETGARPIVDGVEISRDRLDALLAASRERGLARIRGDLTEGINAMSAPVLDLNGDIAFAFTILGPSGAFDARWDSASAQLLRNAADACSRNLGARPPLWRND